MILNPNIMSAISEVFEKWERILRSEGFEFESTDFDRPWGGFFVIREEDADLFMRTYYPEEDATSLTKGGKVSPKILIVAPGKRLSWQYHHRRSEVWKVVEGIVGVKRSLSDEQGPLILYKEGETIVLHKGERHRLIGLDEVGVIAEIWQHTDPDHPSDENDIVRLQDDFGR
jgi:mannose-6-phosphate isomerase